MGKKTISAAILALLLFVGAVASGCGSDSSTTAASSDPTSTASTQATPPHLSKAAFIKKANAVCAENEEARSQGMEAAIKNNDKGYNMSLGEQGQILVKGVIVPHVMALADELEGLGVPKGEEAKVAAIIGAMRKGAAESKADPASALEEHTPFYHGNVLAANYGLITCGI